ncbi:HAMP domain-containing sensor histidine kinase [Streptomyces sp. NPDC048442]|uniref:HAMP domain-containing sensor histidine kinase n=1 Tax=Streptomyces sp. NPDC048442 TaxID=3154823 RepID=UPI003412E03B
MPPDPKRLPLRSRLLARLLAVSFLVAVCSIAATAWLAVQATTGAIRQERGQALAEDARIYDTLLGIAARGPRWAGAAGAVRTLAASSGHRIALTSHDGRVIADSAPGRPLPDRPSAVVDPLAVDRALTPDGTAPGTAPGAGTTNPGGVGDRPTGPRPTLPSPVTGTPGVVHPGGTNGRAAAPVPDTRIDPRAAGPYTLPRKEHDALRQYAGSRAACLRRAGFDAVVDESPAGRPYVRVPHDPNLASAQTCEAPLLNAATPTERKALDALSATIGACMQRRGLSGGIIIRPDFTWDPTLPHGAASQQTISECVAAGRKEQLTPYVSPAAVLYLSDPADDRTAGPGFALSSGGTWRMAGAAALVLLVTVAVTALAASRLVRPLRALTAAAQRMTSGDTPGAPGAPDTPGAPGHAPLPPASTSGEIGQLTDAFNELNAHRAALETQRKAMVGDVAHELRTPLANIRGWLEAAQDGVADVDAALISSLHEEALQLQHIIDDLQDLSAADAGTLRMHPEPLDLAVLLDQVASAHGARTEAAGVHLSVRTQGPTEWTADPVRMRQALGNLVSNAVRHTPAGGSVTLHARQSPADGVHLSVSDTGVGIAPDQLPHVFDRFWRAEKSRSRSTGGSGLGLAIVRKLVEAHGGRVGVTSEVGRGTTFAIDFPAGGPELQKLRE